jgi:D-arabinose 1-dehydrogenase-like Zn-dependent alcohol dehydrogenase
LKQVELLGSLGGTPEDTVEVIKFLASGDLKIAVNQIDFDDIRSGLGQLARGEVQGQRLVATTGR